MRKLGKNDLRVGDSYNNIANVHDSCGDFDKALEFHNKSLELNLSTVGDKHYTAIS